MLSTETGLHGLFNKLNLLKMVKRIISQLIRSKYLHRKLSYPKMPAVDKILVCFLKSIGNDIEKKLDIAMKDTPIHTCLKQSYFYVKFI